ncbi:hypothetical protein QZH41_018040 [Actinostola sp. cb2023]|nr:hypothetical protein QZH41_018040 [Actinostola sp. cb2023]
MADEVKNSISRGSIEVCRIMVPDDANIAGNVHGGTTLKVIEEAGYIIATRHCNKTRSSPNTHYNAALARVERTDFLQPVYIGEVVQVHAELGYASKHSLEVTVCVWAENLVTGSRRLTNRASLWYVPYDVVQSRDGKTVIGEVPPVDTLNDVDMEKGKARYESQKRARLEKQELLKKFPCNCTVNHCMASHVEGEEAPIHCVAASQSSFIHFVQPSECGEHGFLYGGVLMKMMDDLAGTVAYRHCKTNVVTASIGSCYRACSAFFTFVSLDTNHRPQAIPAIDLQTDDERQRFEEGKKRYEERKQRRLSHS